MENKKMEELKASALNSIKNSKDLKSLEEIRVKFLGRKDGEITRILRSLKDLSIEEKEKLVRWRMLCKKKLKKGLMRN